MLTKPKPYLYIQTSVASSCAISSLSGIGEFSNPVDILRSFCQTELGRVTRFNAGYKHLAAFYVFSAGPEVRSTDPGGTHHSKDHWPRYGTEFAQYLVENRLGEVSTLPPKLNLRHHNTSTAQVWLWSPDQTELQNWWKNQQEVNPTEICPAVSDEIQYDVDDEPNKYDNYDPADYRDDPDLGDYNDDYYDYR